MAKLNTLIYNGHHKKHVEGSIYKQEKDGCLLIANVCPAGAISQEQHNKNMELIVRTLNMYGVGKELKKG